jgi:ATP-dependent helicase/DNAse subunit B
MPITLLTGPATAGKAEVVMEAVRRHLAQGSEPLLVVPTRADAEHYLRELAGRRAAIGVRVERFAGLIGEAVRRAGLSEQVLGPIAREQLLTALATRAGSSQASRGFVRGLGELLAELQVRRVTAARLSRALADWVAVDGPAAPQASLGPLFGEYRAAYGRSMRSGNVRRCGAARPCCSTALTT